MLIPKNKPLVSKKLRDSARGKDCLVRLPGICRNRTDTTVLAHLGGGGKGIKKGDLSASFACFECHEEIDRRTRILDKSFVELAHREGVERTIDWWLQHGFIKVL